VQVDARSQREGKGEVMHVRTACQDELKYRESYREKLVFSPVHEMFCRCGENMVTCVEKITHPKGNRKTEEQINVEPQKCQQASINPMTRTKAVGHFCRSFARLFVCSSVPKGGRTAEQRNK
jgi:hypothetical protein